MFFSETLNETARSRFVCRGVAGDNRRGLTSFKQALGVKLVYIDLAASGPIMFRGIIVNHVVFCVTFLVCILISLISEVIPGG